jgi:thioredoxin-dependent peroxiredoxin
MALTVGDLAPDFTLPDSDGKPVSLQDFRGQWLVLYFYPRDLTPGCTQEACGFRDLSPQLPTQVAIIGISTDNGKSHQKFITKHQLSFPLLSDTSGEVATLYDSYGPKKFMGKDLVGVYRRTFLISPEGKIAKIYPKVKPAAHAAEVLADLTQCLSS